MLSQEQVQKRRTSHLEQRIKELEKRRKTKLKTSTTPPKMTDEERINEIIREEAINKNRGHLSRQKDLVSSPGTLPDTPRDTSLDTPLGTPPGTPPEQSVEEDIGQNFYPSELKRLLLKEMEDDNQSKKRDQELQNKYDKIENEKIKKEKERKQELQNKYDEIDKEHEIEKKKQLEKDKEREAEVSHQLSRWQEMLRNNKKGGFNKSLTKRCKTNRQHKRSAKRSRTRRTLRRQVRSHRRRN